LSAHREKDGMYFISNNIKESEEYQENDGKSDTKIGGESVSIFFFI